jgi:hypothetical protein
MVTIACTSGVWGGADWTFLAQPPAYYCQPPPLTGGKRIAALSMNVSAAS